MDPDSQTTDQTSNSQTVSVQTQPEGQLGQNFMGLAQNNRHSFSPLTLVIPALVLLIALGVWANFFFPNNITNSVKPLSNESNTTRQLTYCDTDTKVYTDIKEALKDPDKVCTLDLSFQNLEKAPAEISKFKNLVYLNLGNNKIKELPKELSSLKSIVRLDAPGNQLTSLSKDIGKLSNLETLNLNNNKIASIPQDLGNLTELETLLLANNNISEFPTKINNLKSLKALVLIGNKVSESEKLKIQNFLPETTVNFEIDKSPQTSGSSTLITR